MTVTLKVNARNDLHLPADVLERLNLGADRLVKAEMKNSMLILMPVDLEPRYTSEELAGLDQLHDDEKKKGWKRLKTSVDIDRLLT